jgi:hypothetical protein
MYFGPDRNFINTFLRKFQVHVLLIKNYTCAPVTWTKSQSPNGIEKRDIATKYKGCVHCSCASWLCHLITALYCRDENVKNSAVCWPHVVN